MADEQVGTRRGQLEHRVGTVTYGQAWMALLIALLL